MNKQEADILILLAEKPFENQRILSEQSGRSLGSVNKSLKALKEAGYLTEDFRLTHLADQELSANRPRRAVILAAGFGMRMVPINLTSPKALLMVRGERLIERLIRQLHEVDITDITVVVGFMKDQFEYLIDTYGVKLLVNSEYSSRNNLHSMALAAGVKRRRLGSPRPSSRGQSTADAIQGAMSGAGQNREMTPGGQNKEKLPGGQNKEKLPGGQNHEYPQDGNLYIVPCDLWCEENPFHREELYSWYMMAEEEDIDSGLRINRKEEIVRCKTGETGHRMAGISYLTDRDWEWLKEAILNMDGSHRYDDFFWEEALFSGSPDRMRIAAKTVTGDGIVEINTYEQLRDIDSGSGHLASEAIRVIRDHFRVDERAITDITMLKKGMTNRSFLFRIGDRKYIMRIPGEGTELLINRKEEAEVFRAISNKGFCDDPELILPEKGYKITRYLEGVRTCDAGDEEDLRKCMTLLGKLHSMHLKVDHTFDIFGQIEFYEGLWDGEPSIYPDYADTKRKVLELKRFIDSQPKDWCLTHIDANCDNFLFYKEGGSEDGEESGKESLQLTDWEYAGMQDPHVDIAMFGIYSMYEKDEVDRLIDIYFDSIGAGGGILAPAVRAKIYCYIAACGLLWSNWCEYKRKFGVEFGEYSLRQYRYAKEYYRYARELI